MQEPTPAPVRKPSEENEKPDIYRLRWMGAAVGAIFAAICVVFFSANVLATIGLMHWVGASRSREYHSFFQFLTEKAPIGISLTYLIFIVLGGLAGFRVVQAIQHKMNGMRYGFWYGWQSLFMALFFGMNCMVLAGKGWEGFIQTFSARGNEYLEISFALLFISIISSIIFGSLLGFSIERLSKTPGFGVRGEQLIP